VSTAAESDDGTAVAEPVTGGTLRAFRHRDYTIFWLGALVSNTGSWLQNLTVPYVVFEITGSAFWVGVATAAQFLPGFFGSPLGGHLADTRERRRLLIVLLSVMAVLAVGLWWTWESGSRSLTVILLLVSASGLVWGTTLPSWQAFVNDLVPREDLVSAVSLNSLQFNAARSLGPAVAGLIIASFGPGVAFGLNAASFAFVVGALLLVRVRSKVAGGIAPRLVSGFVEAVRYVPRQPGIAVVVVTVGLVGLLATPAFGFTVVFAGSVYDVGPLALGVLNTALGVGAILAVPIVVRAKSHRGLAGSIRGGLLLQGGAIVAFGLAPGFITGALALVAVGMGFLLTISSGNTAVQLIVAQRLRGRVMAVRLMVYMVATPIGALAQGWLSDRIGPRPTMVVAGLLVLVVGAWFLTRRGATQLARVDDPEDLDPLQ
jgi:MFS family permease